MKKNLFILLSILVLSSCGEVISSNGNISSSDNSFSSSTTSSNTTSSNSTNSMFEEQEAKSYTEETGVFANHHISGGDTGMQKRETIDYEIRGTYASLRKSEKKGHI